jgi:hypothetical protein
MGGRSFQDLFLGLIRGYSVFNSHLTLTLDWFGTVTVEEKATNPEWPKWTPSG